jgi:hypothetical protein
MDADWLLTHPTTFAPGLLKRGTTSAGYGRPEAVPSKITARCARSSALTRSDLRPSASPGFERTARHAWLGTARGSTRLLCPQGNDRIHPRGSARRNPAREQCHRNQRRGPPHRTQQGRSRPPSSGMTPIAPMPTANVISATIAKTGSRRRERHDTRTSRSSSASSGGVEEFGMPVRHRHVRREFDSDPSNGLADSRANAEFAEDAEARSKLLRP